MDNSLFGDFVYTTASKIFSSQPVIDPSLPNQFIQCVGVTRASAAPPGDHSKVVTESQPGHHFCWSNSCSVFQHCHMLPCEHPGTYTPPPHQHPVPRQRVLFLLKLITISLVLFIFRTPQNHPLVLCPLPAYH